MHSKEQLVELHIREYESRQKHVDELLHTVKKHAENKPELQDNLKAFKEQRDGLSEELTELKQRPIDEWAAHEIEDAGPMGIWYGLITELETLIERIEK
jgi:hypothetical protein